jgi:hypothetical protein
VDNETNSQLLIIADKRRVTSKLIAWKKSVSKDGIRLAYIPFECVLESIADLLNLLKRGQPSWTPVRFAIRRLTAMG